MNIDTGDLLLFSGDLIPEGFAACDGSRLVIAHYPSLFRRLGTRHGGDGVTDFAVPNLPAPNGGIYLIRIDGPSLCASPFLQPAPAPRLESSQARPAYLPTHAHAA